MYKRQDIIIYVGCGERGNEMTQALKEFGEISDPRTGKPLTDRPYVNLGGGKEEVKTVSAKMHYVEQGSGEPLILVHGITQSLYTYRKNIKELSQKYRVIAVDLLGYGYSEKADITYSVEENALSLEAFMNSLKIPSANFCAFGESWAYVIDVYKRQEKN